MPEPHASRGHAEWSASASSRRWACPGSLTLEALGTAKDKESHAAAWGTACHEISEKALLGDGNCAVFLGETVKTKEHEIEVDDEMVECAQVYVDYVRGAVTGKLTQLLLEQNFSLAKINPPFGAGGTGDAVVLHYAEDWLEIIDLKSGWGVVDVKDNKQLRTYALGALLANPGSWEKVKVTIVQPRAPHPDGRIRSEEFHVADLMDWTADLLLAMQKAKAAQARFEKSGLKPWAASYLNAGEHCTFCRAAGTCPAVQSRALEAAHTHFQDETGAVATPPAPETLETAQIVRILDAADMIENWLKSVRAHATHLAEAGTPVTDGTSDYILTAKRATRKWAEAVDGEVLALKAAREAEDFYQEPKLMSPAQVEKLLGKKGYEAIQDLVVKESSGYSLTRADKTTRPAITPPAQKFFQPTE